MVRTVKVRQFFKLLLAAVFLYGVGFASFIAMVPQGAGGSVRDVQGLAVFTGGSGRVDTAVALIEQGFVGPVLVSGAHPEVRVADLAGVSALQEWQRGLIQLDYAATTRQNVGNTRHWAGLHGIRRLGVVTSTYHVPRVKVLWWLLAPGIELVVIPVRPVDGGWRTLFREYNKFLLTPVLP